MDNLVRTISKGFSSSKIMIVGDLVADQFLSGSITRVSREAPVFILRHDETETLPGAAANAAANVATLGSAPILIGLIGDDPDGVLLTGSLAKFGVDTSKIVIDPINPTIKKVRVLAGQDYAPRQQVIRIDYESHASRSQDLHAGLLRNLDSVQNEIDAIIVSDYGYGVVTQEIYARCLEISLARDIPLIIDSRYRLKEFKGATSATPNREEIEQILGPGFAKDDCESLRKMLGLKSLLITNGNEGMSLFEQGNSVVMIPVYGSSLPVDVTGAGDTVIAAYTLSLSCGLSFQVAAKIANIAGGIVVMKKGTATVLVDEIIGALGENHNLAVTSPN